MIFTVDLTQNFNEAQRIARKRKIKYTISNTEELNRKIFLIEAKITPEKMIVAFTKAENDAIKLIDELKQKSGWSNWISSSVRNIIGYGYSNGSSQSQEIETFQKQELLEIQKMDELIK